MNPVTIHKGSRAIVYDADAVPAGAAELFDPEYWCGQGALEGSAPGRGTSHFLDTPFGPAVLRRYRRGGMVARFNRERYLYRGLEASRPFREFHLLREMNEDGLRVPAPLAALCHREGPFYRAALLTRRIAPARPLVDHFRDENFDWKRLGGELRSFFDAGMAHADLNARNILVHDENGAAWVIDLDASRYSGGHPVDGTRQLERLKRSLVKLWPEDGPALDPCWDALWAGSGA